MTLANSTDLVVIVAKALELPLRADFASEQPGANECFGVHDDFKSGALSDLVADFEHPALETDFGGVLNEEHGIQFTGHTLALSNNATRDIAVRFIASGLTKSNSANLSMLAPPLLGEARARSPCVSRAPLTDGS